MTSRTIADAPRAGRAFDTELRESDRLLAQAHNQNEILVTALQEAREQIATLKEEIDKLCAPPSTYGVYLAANEDNTVTILSQGRKVKVNLHLAALREDRDGVVLVGGEIHAVRRGRGAE